MKKNFFKKLSFVMALAMIVTALAPAAGVFAAAAPKLNAKKVYIHVAEKTTEFDFNVSNKKTGWKYSWKSSNEDVAEVASNGLVTAVGKGTATISVTIKNKNGEKVDTLKGTVVVRDNIKKLTIKNPVEKLAVGAKHDFNRNFVTASGNKKVTSGITRWEVDKTGATIVADSGLFTATEAGTYTITARAFQSTAKYNSWLTDKTKYASYVTATTTTTVKVAADTVKAAQTTLSKVSLTFDSAMTDDVKSKISVYKLSGTTEIVAAIKEVSLDTTKKIATIEMYSPFAEESTYVIKTTDMKDQSFVAVTSNVADVAEIKITTTQVEVNDARDISVDILNKDGVNIGDTELKGRITFESSNTSAYLNKTVSPNQLTLFNIGDTTTLTATFHTYDYDYATSTEKGIKTATQVVTCVKELSTNAGNIEAWTIVASGPNYNDLKKSLTLSDTNGAKTLYVKAKYDNNDDNDFDDPGDTVKSEDGGDWSFTSANPGVLNIHELTGQLYPATTGTAVVIVKYKGSELGTVVITVSAKREVASLSLDATQFDLSTDLDVKDTKTVTLTVKDQLGDKLAASAYTATITRSNAVPANNGNVVFGASHAEISDGLTFTAGTDTSSFVFDATDGDLSSSAEATTAAAVGTHAYTVKVVDNNNSNKVIYGYVSISVKEPTTDGNVVGDSGISYYKVETDKAAYDMKLTTSDFAEPVTVTAFGYASNGVKNVRVDFATPAAPADTFTVDMYTPKSNTITLTDGGVATASKRTFNLVESDTSIYEKVDKGNYIVTLKKGTVAKNTINFKVEDTQPAPVLTVNKLSTSYAVSGVGDALAAIQDCFNVTISGNDVESTITGINVTGYGKSWFVHEFYVTETLNGKTLRHKVEVNKNMLTAQ